MHEVSFQDKEKEHLTRLQDAEEMKVCMAAPSTGPSMHLDWIFLFEENVSFKDVCGSVVGGRGEADAGHSELFSECGLAYKSWRCLEILDVCS